MSSFDTLLSRLEVIALAAGCRLMANSHRQKKEMVDLNKNRAGLYVLNINGVYSKFKAERMSMLGTEQVHPRR